MKSFIQTLGLAMAYIVICTNLIAQDYHNVFKLGANQHDEAQGLVQDSQGNIYLSGNFEGTVDFDPSEDEATLTAIGKYDAYLVKYDQNGNYIWAISIGGNEWIYGRHIVLDEEGNIYMAGYFKGEADFDPSANDFFLDGVELDGFLAKYDENGNFIWAFDIGNDYSSYSYDIGMDMQGNIWVTGVFKDTLDFDPSENEFILTGHGFQDAFLAKYTQDGEFIWAGEFGGETSIFYNPTFTFDESGYLYYTTYFDNQVDLDPGTGTYIVESAGSSDIMLLKLDLDGNFQWGFSMGGTLQDHTRDIHFNNGQVLLTGFFEETIDFDPSQGEVVYTSTGDYDAYIAAYSTDGEYIWAKALASTDPAEGHALNTDVDDNIYLCGTFYGTVDFDPSSAVTELSAQGSWDIFTAKYDPIGNFQWAIYAGGNDNDYAYNILVTSDQEDVMVCGKFKGFAEFDHTGPGYIISSAGGFDAFLASYSSFPGSSVQEVTNGISKLTISPNPCSASSFINLKLNEKGDCSILVSTIEGKTVKEIFAGTLRPGSYQYELELDDMAEGMYLISVITGDQRITSKLLVVKP